MSTATDQGCALAEPLPARPVASDASQLGEQEIELSIVIPCLNEALTVGRCIDTAIDYFRRSGIQGEVVIADNGSTDGSPDIARVHGARVVSVPRKGYGSALLGGIDAALGRFVIMGDADGSHDFSQLDAFLERLRGGDDLVVGNRFKGGIRPGAMPWLHRHVGNPVLSGILNLFFHTPVGDAHCGLRGFPKESYRWLGLATTGMEFASEMVVKAALMGQKISEVPTVHHPDGRGRPPHLRSFRDGWRHLRFLLLMCPGWLYFVPAVLMLATGLGLVAWQASGPGTARNTEPDLHLLAFGCLCLVLGSQSLWLWAFAGIHYWSIGLAPSSQPPIGWFRHLTLERGLVLGGLVLLGGLGLSGRVWLSGWEADSGSSPIRSAIRLGLASGMLILLGFQIIYASFFMYIMRSNRLDNL